MSFYRCKEPFSYTEPDGLTAVSVRMGDVMDSEDPAFAKRAQFFEEIRSSHAAVEDASAEPGAFRSLTHRRRGRPPKAVEPEPASEAPKPEPEPVSEPDVEPEEK